ncbi:hypothetical protein H4R99_004517 [Coemansia sp. RSA 1722]|nr:hypothetical protein LPJ57_006656 [Coemansia sp. RSA 486]KAJ2219015.1 hypothetical protein IWW45_009414 [Coemansia sp. RSA 485]KAJ2597322.1 hypothetical protein GGF39_003093 [Coemansia sp. RSA 1721]KAJ2597424.1 hypothetical protein H4R99_004517 [Coemansia sp. RSA 1722]KAJ2636115.1 hypothetical protein GGF40_003205 [Coemansia sp. RSA 1286]KAJ2696663.1 hypothetical protein FB645_006144 [Coemansia sp. IMI 203386]
MADSELEAIRARRAAEIQSQQGEFGANPQDDSAENAAKREQENARNNMLTQLLDNSARERLGRIAIVNAGKARSVEDLIIRMGQVGQLKKRITEDDLKELLEEINKQHSAETKIVVNRKSYGYSDDEEEEEYDF